MSLAPAVPRSSRTWLPWPWWILLGGALLVGMKVSWGVAVVILLFALVQRLWPLDFLVSYVIVVAAASFADYGSGVLTSQMLIFIPLLVFMLYCYLLSRRSNALVIWRSPATTPLLLFLGLTVLNFVRGMLSGNPFRYGGIEFLALLGLGTAFLIANRRLTRSELQVVMISLVIVSIPQLMFGIRAYIEAHGRTGGFYFSPVPGAIALLLFNFALREPRGRNAALWAVAMIPSLLDQFLSFTRGYWLALMVTIPFSIVVYAGRGAGAGTRWRRALMVLAILTGLGIVGVILMAGKVGVSGIGSIAAARLGSSTQVEYTGETASNMSNIVRLAEYLDVIGLILKNPWFGYGIGYAFVKRETFSNHLIYQWFVHENYLLVWLKQGLVGLALWIWVLVGCYRTGMKGRKLADWAEQSWCMGTAAVVLFCIIYSFVHFPLAELNTVYLFAFCVGTSMRFTTTDSIAVRWKASVPTPESVPQEPAPNPSGGAT